MSNEFGYPEDQRKAPTADQKLRAENRRLRAAFLAVIEIANKPDAMTREAADFVAQMYAEAISPRQDGKDWTLARSQEDDGYAPS